MIAEMALHQPSVSAITSGRQSDFRAQQFHRVARAMQRRREILERRDFAGNFAQYAAVGAGLLAAERGQRRVILSGRPSGSVVFALTMANDINIKRAKIGHWRSG